MDARGLLEGHAYDVALEHTPRDDWDLAPRQFLAQGFPDVPALQGLLEVTPVTDSVQQVTVNTLARENQVAFFMRRLYGDRTIAASHIRRYSEIAWFLGRHERRLARDGLLRRAPDGSRDLNEALLDALCRLPYQATVRRQHGARRAFRYRDVRQLARQLDDGGDIAADGRGNP